MKKQITFLILFFSTLLFLNAAWAIDPDKQKVANLNKGVFLIASKQLDYTSMRKTVIYLVQHDEAGSSGIIINHPTNLKINEAFPDTKASDYSNKTLFFGGPLHTQYLFMLTQTKFTRGLFEINQGVYFGTGDQIKVRLQAEKTPDTIRTFAGFMSWGPEQLEQEIMDGTWILSPAAPEEVFSKDSTKLWEKLFKRWSGSWT
ncbi:MAG: YqgE/AlgH family protein [Gammaproteobacteria bacterium]|nr:YqgE/AlgH family protein [Gammaproteobacteria bacterium]